MKKIIILLIALLATCHISMAIHEDGTNDSKIFNLKRNLNIINEYFFR
jgi:hypothetical protein